MSIIVACLTATCGLTNAATVVFGTNWLTEGFFDNASTVQTAAIAVDGVTFSLTATAVGGNINTNAGGTLFGVGNARVDGAGDGLGDGQSVTFTLATSGATLSQLLLNTLDLAFFAVCFIASP